MRFISQFSGKMLQTLLFASLEQYERSSRCAYCSFQIFFKEEGKVIEWNAILKPFGGFVWLSIILWLLVGSLVMDLLFFSGCTIGTEKKVYGKEFTPINSFLILFRAICQQGKHKRSSFL